MTAPLVLYSTPRQASEIQRVAGRLAELLESATGQAHEVTWHPLPSQPTAITVVRPAGREPASEWISTGEAATILGCSSWTIRQMVEDGRLPSNRVGRLVKVFRPAVEALGQVTR